MKHKYRIFTGYGSAVKTRDIEADAVRATDGVAVFFEDLPLHSEEFGSMTTTVATLIIPTDEFVRIELIKEAV